MEAQMQNAIANVRTDLLSSGTHRVLDAFGRWWRRQFRSDLDGLDTAEVEAIARDLGTGRSELRELARHDRNSAELLDRRLAAQDIRPDQIEAAVMQDLRRCCTQCRDKVLCTHELEDRPKNASWPKYCPNEYTIGALLAQTKASSR
jgi:hypothetical protein